MTRRPSTRPRAYAPDPDAPGRICDMPGCPEPGAYRAPKSRDTLNDYHWFCLEHVRQYNANWDFYKGMTPWADRGADAARYVVAAAHLAARHQRQAQRSTRPTCATRSSLLQTGKIKRAQKAYQASADDASMPKEMREPDPGELGLEWPVSMDVLKARYKELAKRHHPDANGGDRAAEERLKTINLAYAAVRHYLTTEPRMAATG